MTADVPTQNALGLLYTTWPDSDGPERAAQTLLEEGLIACANILGEARSVFRWQGEICRETEIIALFKTSTAQAAAVRDRLAALHPYEEPCILNLGVSEAASAPGFVHWVNSETRAR